VTVAAALRDAAARLGPTSDTARLDAELLMAHALGSSRSDMLLRHMQEEAPPAFPDLLRRRMAHEPVAHITGETEFYGRPFRVTRDVLVPRADSESVVEAAFSACPAPARVLDLGTGSGILLLTVLAEWPAAQGVGTDRSPTALAVAGDNAERLGLADRAQMLKRDWTVPGWADGLGTFDLVLSNPPYVEDDAALEPAVREHEPAGALFAGPEGLDDYRCLVPQLRALLAPGGGAVLEIGASQAAAVGALAEAEGFACKVRQDLGGRDRALILH
jgi:release factor glutamine methyltransferase